MRKMESKDKTNCFICCNKILNPEDCNFQETVDVNILVIFMLRNLLDIPKSLCENLLSRKGNPSDWILCCPFCVSLTRQAQTIFLKKMELEQKFNELKSKIISTASYQWRLFNEIPNAKQHKNDFTEEIIRNVFLNHAGSTENSQILLKLDPDESTTVIKEDGQCFYHDTFEEISLNDSFVWDNTSVVSDDDMLGDNCSQIPDNPLLQSRLKKRKIDNTSEKLEKEKCTNQSLESITKNEVNTDFDPNDPYVCGECGQRFPYIHLKELHQRKHQYNVNKEKKSQKQKHQKNVNKCEKEVQKQKCQKNVKCDKCNEFFKTRNSLAAHQDHCHTPPQLTNDVNRNSNLHCEEKGQDIKLCDFTNDGDSDNLNSLPSDSKTTETEISDKDISTKAEKEKSMRPKRAKKAVAYKKKTLDSDSDYSPDDDSDSEFEKGAFGSGSDDSDMSDSDMKATKQKKEPQTEPRMPKRLSKLISMTSEFPFKCNDCEMSFQYSHMQKLHRLKAHNVEMQCEQCDSKFETRQGWTVHCQRNHPDISYPGVRFRAYEKTSMKCPVCGELLHPGSIKVHLQAHESISCYICAKPFARLNRLARHQRKHHYKECNLIPIQCLECEKTFVTRRQLGKHIISKHTKEYPESCPICNVGVLSCNLKKHIERVHTQAKPYMCSFCGKAYCVKAELESHEIIKHTRNFKFTCDVCGKQFAKNHALVKHKLLHLNFPKPFVCELCGDSFREKHKFQYHQRGQHYKELNLEPFQCFECGTIYTCPEGLRNHNIRVHEEDPKKHICTDCGEKFINPSTLKDHIRRHHTGEKIFSCSYCDKRYFTKKSLEKHVQRYHTKDFSFKCTLCPLGYSDSWSMNRHLKLIHGQDKESL